MDSEALFRQYRRPVFAYFYRRCRCADTANDLTSQVFLRVVQAEKRGHGCHTHPSGWLFRIARNLLIDHVRRASRQNVLPLLDFDCYPATTGDPMAEAERQIECERLHFRIDRLTAGQRQVIVLHYLDGYSYVEIAEQMQSNPPAVKALRRRGLATMRQQGGLR